MSPATLMTNPSRQAAPTTIGPDMRTAIVDRGLGFLDACVHCSASHPDGWNAVKDEAKVGCRAERQVLRMALSVALRDAIMDRHLTLAEACAEYGVNYDRGWGFVQVFPEVVALLKTKWSRGERQVDRDRESRNEAFQVATLGQGPGGMGRQAPSLVECHSHDVVTSGGHPDIVHMAGGAVENRRERRARMTAELLDAILRDNLTLGDAARKVGIPYDRAWAMVGNDARVRAKMATKWRDGEVHDVVAQMRNDIVTGGMTLGEAARFRGVEYNWAWNKLSKDPAVRAKIDTKWTKGKPRKAADRKGAVDCGPAISFEPKEPIANDLFRTVSSSVRSRVVDALVIPEPTARICVVDECVPMLDMNEPEIEVVSATAVMPMEDNLAPFSLEGIEGVAGTEGDVLDDVATPAPIRIRPTQGVSWMDESTGILLLLIDVLENNDPDYAPRFDATIENMAHLQERADMLPMVVVWFNDDDNRMVISPNPSKAEDFLNEHGYFRGEPKFERLYLIIMDYLAGLARFHRDAPMDIVPAVDASVIDQALASLN